jgi:prophage regulatory protein
MSIAKTSSTRVERIGSVIQRTGKSRSSIYAAMAADSFPKCFKIGARAVGWSSDEIDAWIELCVRGGK